MAPPSPRSKSAPYRGSILVLDDEQNMGRILTKILNNEGYHVTAMHDPREALDFLLQSPTDLVLCDIRMPGMSGHEVLQSLRDEAVPCEVIMMTAFGTIENAIDCVKLGALDYITKPFKTDELLLTIQRTFEHKRLKDMNGALSEAFNNPDGSNEGAGRPLLGDSPAMCRVRDMIGKVAPSDSPVLITGESGTGKELAARAIHVHSRRKNGRFVAINCASIPEQLLESELFGYEKGAFTGADRTKVGLIELADGGTLFLDEVGELPLAMQAKLLRVLQEREITRLGGVTHIPVDLRVVSATNRNLEKCIGDRTFREDLFYRLNVISLQMPALRDRQDDIPLLAEHFLATKSAKAQREGIRFSDALVAAFTAAEWRGNVRELENLVERLVVLSETDVITTEMLPDSMIDRHPSNGSVTKLGLSAQAMVEEVPDFRAARESFERGYLEALLRQHAGSVTEAARHAGMSRRNLYDKIEKLGIPLDEIKKDESNVTGEDPRQASA